MPSGSRSSDDVALADGPLGDRGERRHPIAQDSSPAVRRRGRSIRADSDPARADLVADVVDGDEIGDVDQGLQARELRSASSSSTASRATAARYSMIADASACLDRKWKYIAPLVTSASARMSSRLTKLYDLWANWREAARRICSRVVSARLSSLFGH